MGLDMYLHDHKSFYTGTSAAESIRKEDGLDIDSMTLDIGYWRKHPNLHGFIVQTFAEGVDECQDIALDEDALDQIITAVANGDLPHTEGFFFGSSEGDEAEKARDIAIFEKAKVWLLSAPETDREDPASSAPGAEFYRSVIYRASW